ncbi:(4-(4-[2-(gamma-L-glutamylamino)ethyl]phenoxymethyl)furan-2-yl)methanamine synthase [biofilm metagenome]
MQTNTMGWDIGGAHLKAAVVNPHSEVVAVYQCPCQLWKGLDKLHEAIEVILAKLPMPVHRHVVTMTGELADLFSDRDDGVKQILAVMADRLGSDDTLVYAGQHGFVKLSGVNANHYSVIASANWLASVTFAAQNIPSGLFVDIGSTTTDILAFAQGNVIAQGYTDYERLISQELIYTGIVRTPVMAVAHTVNDEGREVGLMAEYFATMSDVYRLTGELNENHDQAEAADGGEKTVSASAKRLARMVGCDFYEANLRRWQKLAANLRKSQMNRIQQACVKLQQRSNLPENIPIVGAGIGRFLVNDIARHSGMAYIDYSDLCSGVLGLPEFDASDCAPAVAVACLAASI